MIRLGLLAGAPAPNTGPRELCPLCYHLGRASTPPFADPPGHTQTSFSREDPDPMSDGGHMEHDNVDVEAPDGCHYRWGCC